MLKGQLLHPQILGALARSGHRGQILITDGNYPHSTKANPRAELVFLNLSPGLVSVTQVLEALIPAVPLEKAAVMRRDDGGSVPIWAEFERLLPEITLEPLALFDFYEAARSHDVCLVIATGEQRQWANLLLTIGVVPPT